MASYPVDQGFRLNLNKKRRMIVFGPPLTTFEANNILFGAAGAVVKIG